MKTTSFAAFVAVALVAGTLQVIGAEGARLRHLVSVYADGKGVGFHLPEAVACRGTGAVVVGDTGNDRLVRFDYRERTLSAATEIKIPQLTAPMRVQINSKGEIFALDGKQRRIVRLGADGAFVATLSFDGAPAPATIVPKSFAIDATDAIHVLDTFSARVIVLDAEGRVRKAIPLPSGTGFATDVAVDAAGATIVLDALGRRLYAVAKGQDAFAPLGPDMKRSLITMPTALTTSRGIIFVVEATAGSVVALGLDGTFLSRQLTPGWKDGSLNHPAQMCISDTDDVFVADRDNSRIQVFALTR